MTLPREFYERATKQVAIDLIGKRMISQLGNEETAGIIVETEAYLPNNDSACHASKHRTTRTEVMFGLAGIAYVYPIHAKHCFNVVTEKPELGCAVLIRAIEPIKGISLMHDRRGVEEQLRLTRGPACLCQAMGIDRSVNGRDLTRQDAVWIEDSPTKDEWKIKSSVRIGVTSAKTKRLRFYAAGNPFVSGSKKMRV